jgi:hypothetical protein
MFMEKLSLIELKALAYDQLVQLENAQSNLKLINLEISKRLSSNQSTSDPIPGSIQSI